MAKQILTGLDLLALPSLTTPKTGSVGFGAKSDGLYQKIGTVESKLTTQSDIDTAIDNLEIGGRNLILNSEVSVTNANYNRQYLSLSEQTIVGQGYTFSIRCDDLKGGELNIYDDNIGTHIGRLTFISGNIYGITFNAVDSFSTIRVRNLGNRDNPITTYEAKLEKGNKATDWSPAPEDVQAEINLVQTNLNSHTSLTNNPHSVTKAQVGLGNVNNTADSAKNVLSATKLTTARTINGVSFNGTENITIKASTTATLTRGSYLTGSNFNGSTATTWAVDATSANTASKVVARDASGNFSAGTITAALSGNATTATTATKLGTATVGSTQLPFYLNAGTATAITQANLRIGLFGTTAIGSTELPIYLAANGVPTAITQANLRKGLFGTTAIGSATKPIYINTNGVPTASTSFGGVTGIGTANPLMDGTVAVGTSSLAARQDHRHPVDTSRAAVGQTMYIGTTAVAINRASATLNLTGIGTLAMSGALSGATTITASTSVKAPKVSVGSNWSLELSGTELQIKYGGVVKQRMLSDGTFVAEGGVSALGEGAGGSTGDSYDRLDDWTDYDSSKEGWVLSALLGKDLDTRVTNLNTVVTNVNNSIPNLQVVTSLPTSPTAGVFYFVKE